MNQGIAFARTIRALDADDFRTSKLLLLVAVIVLAGWAWWMLAARITQYEVTTEVQAGPNGAVASFPASAAGRIRVGQRAMLHFGAVTLQAQVRSVGQVSDGHVPVDLQLVTNHQPPAPNPGEARSAELEVSRQSPASIALHTLGRANP